MIRGFADKATRRFFEEGEPSPRWRNVERIVGRKLDMLDAAVSLDSLKSPPGNHLEALTRDRAGQHSIRDNDKWRVCFVWTDRGPDRVAVVDYH